MSEAGSDRRIRVVVPSSKLPEDGSLDTAVEQLRSSGHDVAVVEVGDAGAAGKTATGLAGEGIGRIVAAGGDGTLNQVAAALCAAGGKSALGLMPLGTANDFAAFCDIPAGDPLAALEIVAKAEPVRVDLGRCNDRIFLNMATAGAGTSITIETPEDLKAQLGGLAYVLTGLKRLGSFEALQIAVRGEGLDWSGAAYVVAVGNGRRAGGGMPLCPDAVIDDGFLDLTLVPEFDLGRLVSALDDDPDGGFLIRQKLRSIEITSPAPLQVNLDGEPIRSERFAIECLAQALPLCLPADAPCLRAGTA